MALISNYKLPFNQVVPVYYMVSGIEHDRLANTVKASLTAWKDAAARQAFKAAVSAAPGLDQQLKDAQAFFLASETMVEQEARQPVVVDLQAQSQANAKAMQDNAGLFCGAAAIPAGDVSKVLGTDGMVDLAGLYAYLKVLPEFAGAVDA